VETCHQFWHLSHLHAIGNTPTAYAAQRDHQPYRANNRQPFERQRSDDRNRPEPVERQFARQQHQHQPQQPQQQQQQQPQRQRQQQQEQPAAAAAT